MRLYCHPDLQLINPEGGTDHSDPRGRVGEPARVARRGLSIDAGAVKREYLAAFAALMRKAQPAPYAAQPRRSRPRRSVL